MRNGLALCAAAVISAAGFASEAKAADVISACSTSDFTAADACSGYYEGNLLNNKHVQDQIDALALIGFTFNGDWSAVDQAGIKIKPTGDSTYDFATLLNGTTFIGVHKGNGGQGGVQATAFYRLEADNLDTIEYKLEGGSSAVLYATGVGAVPEPTTWAMMLLGFFALGSVMRRRRPESQLKLSRA